MRAIEGESARRYRPRRAPWRGERSFGRSRPSLSVRRTLIVESVCFFVEVGGLGLLGLDALGHISGPFGAEGLVNGSVAIQALKATKNCARNRCSATVIAVVLPSPYAVNHALNVEESLCRPLRRTIPQAWGLPRSVRKDHEASAVKRQVNEEGRHASESIEVTASSIRDRGAAKSKEGRGSFAVRGALRAPIVQRAMCKNRSIRGFSARSFACKASTVLELEANVGLIDRELVSDGSAHLLFGDQERFALSVEVVQRRHLKGPVDSFVPDLGPKRLDRHGKPLCQPK